MGKKKGGQNAFYFFMMDYKKKNSIDIKKVAEKAGPIWKHMSAEAKKPYEDKARTTKGVKLNSVGQNLDFIEKEQKMKVEKEQNMKKDIHKIIDIAAETKVLQDQIFYMLHIHHYCYHDIEKKYYPAEIAIVAFNLHDGIQDTYHKIIVPEQVPLGYKYQVKETAETGHKITIDPDAAPTNTRIVINEIYQMIKANDEVKQHTHPLFIPQKLRPMAENVLETLALESGFDELIFNIYSLEYLFYALRNAVNPSRVCFPSVGVAELELDKDMFEFKEGLSCPFHDTTDAPHMCSLSIVHRSVYAICNHCCKDLGIPLIPGQHVPYDAVVTTCKSEKDGTESQYDVSQQLSVYGDDELTDDDFLDVKCSVDSANMSDSDSDSGFQVVQRGRHHYNKYSQGCSTSQSQSTSVRIPSTQSKVLGNDGPGPFYGRGRGRGRGPTF